MSISLVGVMVGLPIALAARVIMGKEKYEEWLTSSDYNLYTNFSGMEEMRSVVRRAGFDVGDYLNKTHLTASDTPYFFWEEKNGYVTAVMKTYHDKEIIKNFISRVEGIANRKVFFESIEQLKASPKSDVQQLASYKPPVMKKEKHVELKKMPKKISPRNLKYPTIYAGADILTKLLRQYQMKITNFSSTEIICSYEGYQMHFTRSDEEKPFELEVISSDENMDKLFDCIRYLDEDYFANVQERTYIAIKDQLNEEGLSIEEEEVMEDNTIVITVAI